MLSHIPLYTYHFFFFFFNLSQFFFVHLFLFLAVLGLRCCSGSTVTSLVAEQQLQGPAYYSRPSGLAALWHVGSSRIVSAPPASAGGCSAAEPPGGPTTSSLLLLPLMGTEVAAVLATINSAAVEVGCVYPFELVFLFSSEIGVSVFP